MRRSESATLEQTLVDGGLDRNSARILDQIPHKLVTVERNDIPIPFTIKETDFNTLNLKRAVLIQQEQKTETKKEEPKKG